MTGNADRGAPDFARLYGGPGSPVTPRMGGRLWDAALMLADTYGEDRGALLMRSLPPVVRRLAEEMWVARFVSCFEALALRVAEGVVDATRITTCTAEEMALHLVIEAAEDATRDASLDTNVSLPANSDRDDDFDTVRELLFRDHDVLLLFDASLDGIEAPGSVLDEHRLFANLHPRSWFLPFDDDHLPRRRA